MKAQNGQYKYYTTEAHTNYISGSKFLQLKGKWVSELDPF